MSFLTEKKKEEAGKSGKYATLVVRALLSAWKTKNRGTAILERTEFLFRALPLE